MDTLTEAQQTMLRTAIAAGRVPRHTAKRSILATGAGAAPNRRRYVVLADHTGLTNYGRAYYEATGHEPPDRKLDLTQEPTRQGNTEFARDRRGQLVQLRTLRPDGSFAYTKAGRHFYSRRQVEYLVHVPVVVEGRRRNGANYTHSTFLPTHLLGLGRIFAEAGLTQAQREASVRSQVLGQLQVRTEGGRTVLLEISGETWYYDRDRPWLISEMETTPTDHGPQVNVRARQVMAAGPVAATAHIPFAEHVIPEAWQEHDDKLCVVRQLAVLTGASEADLCDDFDRLLDRPWRDEGIATDEVLLFCKDKGFPYYCVGDGRLDVMAARAKVPNVGEKQGELIWLEQPAAGALNGTPWKEHVLSAGPDVDFVLSAHAESDGSGPPPVVAAQYFSAPLLAIYRCAGPTWAACDGGKGISVETLDEDFGPFLC
jgi:hypothetical protein